MNKTERESLAARLAENSIVLLKNENDVLPLASGDTIAVFGRAQTGTLFSGNGSGGAHVAGCQTLLEACEETGLVPEPLLKGFYAYKFAGEPVSEADEFDWTKVSEMVNSGIMYEIFGRYRPPVENLRSPIPLRSRLPKKPTRPCWYWGAIPVERNATATRNLTIFDCQRRKTCRHRLSPFPSCGCGAQHQRPC